MSGQQMHPCHSTAAVAVPDDNNNKSHVTVQGYDTVTRNDIDLRPANPHSSTSRHKSTIDNRQQQRRFLMATATNSCDRAGLRYCHNSDIDLRPANHRSSTNTNKTTIYKLNKQTVRRYGMYTYCIIFKPSICGGLS